jgi:hypothetical protein
MRRVVVQTMAVDKKSRAASTREASTEREEVKSVTMILATRRIVLATKLT